MLTIDTDLGDLVKFLQAYSSRQVPFAMSLALTNTAQDAQLEVRRGLRSRFVLRNSFVEKGILYRKATKANLEAGVFSRDDFMILQEKGGAKEPKSGSSVAVPIEARTAKRGVVPSGKRPRALLSTPGVFRARIGGVDGLWQRLKRRSKARKAAGHSLKLLFVFKPSVPIAPRFEFANTVRRVVKERIGRQLEFAILFALKTAR